MIAERDGDAIASARMLTNPTRSPTMCMMAWDVRGVKPNAPAAKCSANSSVEVEIRQRVWGHFGISTETSMVTTSLPRLMISRVSPAAM